MSRVCEFCGRRTEVGNIIARRGLAKSKGGIGLKTTRVTKRKFKPNIQRMKVQIAGTVRRAKVCMRCLKKGAVTRPTNRPAP